MDINDFKKEGDFMLIWNSDFEIGVEAIDEEHRGIIKQYEKLYLLMKEGKGHDHFQELLSFLETYIYDHFEHEEHLQQEIDFDRFTEHKGYHDEFKAQVKKIIKTHKNKVASNSDLININLFIKDWLINHILIEDKKIGAFIASKISMD